MTDRDATTRQTSSLELNAMAAADAMAWLTERTKPRPTDKALPRVAHAEARILEHRAGPRAQAMDGPGGHGGERPDPTFSAAIRGEDVASRDLADFRHALKEVRRWALRAERIAQVHLTTSKVDPERDPDGEPGCVWCIRVDAWSPIHRTTDCAQFLEASLPSPVPVCVACHRRVRATNAIPTNADLATFHRTGKWPKARVAA